MKEKMKTFIMYFSISFGLIIIFIMINNIRNLTPKFQFMTRDFNSELDSFRMEASTIKNLECRDSMYDLIEFVRDNNFSGVISLRDYFEKVTSKPSVIQKFSNVYSKCNITKDDRTKYYLDVLGIAATNDIYSTIDKYMFQYELTFKDTLRDIYGSNTIGINLDSAYGSELLAISKFIELINEKEVLGYEEN